MKKNYLIFGLAVMLMLSGCSQKNENLTNTTAAAESAETEDKDAEAETEASEKAEAENSEKASEKTGAESSEKAENAGNTEGSHMVTDHTGAEIEVPNNISRVVIDQIPILSTYMSYFGGEAPYIVGYCGSFKNIITETVLKDIAPELLEASDTVYAQSDLNIEEIIKLNPDVILYNANNQEHAEILKASGIPSIGFYTVNGKTPADPLKRYEEWLKLLEDVFNEKGKTDAFIQAGEEITSSVEEIIEKIPEEQRPSALILWQYADGVPKVSGMGTFGQFWLQHLGVKDVAGEMKGFTAASVEQLYSWDPDILFLDGPGLLNIKTEDVLQNKVEGIDFSSLSAVKNGRVYDSTLGMWNWFTPNPDAPLVFAWLASRTYPDYFSDYPLEDTIRDYYKTWYGYEITDSDLSEMLSY